MAHNESLERYIVQFKEKGFTEERLNIDKENRSIEKGLRDAWNEYLPKAKARKKELGFVLEVPAIFKQEKLQYDFLFTIDPSKEQLQLKYVRTHLGKQKDRVIAIGGSIPDSPEQVYQRMIQERAKNLQKAIQQTQTSHTHKKQHL